jgi:hypothetical protein
VQALGQQVENAERRNSSPSGYSAHVRTLQEEGRLVASTATLATSGVLMTPLGANTFDEFGIKALFGRCFMFMDAQNPVVVRVVRAVV